MVAVSRLFIFLNEQQVLLLELLKSSFHIRFSLLYIQLIKTERYISDSLTAHDQEVVGLNPGTDILDGCKRCCSYYVKENTEIKVAKWDPPKHFFTNLINCLKDLLASIPPFGSFFAISKLSAQKGETQSVQEPFQLRFFKRKNLNTQTSLPICASLLQRVTVNCSL